MLHPRRGEDASAFLQSVLAAVPAFILRVDTRGKILYINRPQPGTRADDVVGRNLRDFVPPSEAERAERCIRAVMESGVQDSYEIRATGPNGAAAMYECHVSAVQEGGQCVGACIAAVDVTTHRLRDAALTASEGKLRVALEATGIGLWSWDAVTGEVLWDDRMRALCGRCDPAPPDQYVAELVHPQDRDQVREEISGHMALPQWSSRPHRIVRPDGSERWVTVTGQTQYDQAGNVTGIVGGNFDVTEQRQREDQLRRSQKLDAVGVLSAGMAHNFNNLLTVITPTLDLLETTAPADSRELAQIACKAARRAADLIRQLMTFARGGRRTRLKPLQVNEPVERSVALCRKTFGRDISFETVTARTPIVLADESEVEQVALNLLLNARDAIEETRRRQGTIRVSLDADASGVALAVEDDGVGMTAEVRCRLFEPFFTTKLAGSGSGLGLATSYAILREQGATIECHSQPGRGTRFVVRWPLWAAPVARR